MVSSYLDQLLIIYYFLALFALFSCINVKYATLIYLKQHKHLGIWKYEISSIITLASFKCQV